MADPAGFVADTPNAPAGFIPDAAPSAMQQIGASLHHQSKALFDTLSGIVDPAMGEKIGNGLVDSQVDQWNKAKAAYKSGDTLGAVLHGLGAAVPIVGPLIENSADKFPTRPYEAATDLLAPIALGAAGRLAPEVGDAAAAGAGAVKSAAGTIADVAANPGVRDAVGIVSPRVAHALSVLARAKKAIGTLGNNRDAADSAPSLSPSDPSWTGSPAASGPLASAPAGTPADIVNFPPANTRAEAYAAATAPPARSETAAPPPAPPLQTAAPPPPPAVTSIPFAREPAPAEQFAAANRAPRTQKFADYLEANQVPVADLATLKTSDPFWKTLGDNLGVKKPSAQTVADVIFELRKRQAAQAATAPAQPAAGSMMQPSAAYQNVLMNNPRALAAAQAMAGMDLKPLETPADATISTDDSAGTGSGAQELPLPAALERSSGPGGGAATQIPVPGQSGSYPARYQVLDLADLQPSHNGATFQPNPDYGLTNDRDYTRRENQGKILDGAAPGKFNPAYLITDNPDATNGPPILDSANNVIGGNGRSMILQRVFSANPPGAAAYTQMLQQKAAQFGIDPAQLAGFKNPVLVRQIADEDLASPQQAVTDFNKTGTAALRGSERAIADSRRVSPDTLDSIAGHLENAGPNATLNDVLKGPHGMDVFNKLIGDGVIAPQERAAYVDQGALTQDGQARISKLLLGRFFRDPSQLDTISTPIRNKLERIAAPLAKTETAPGWSMTGTVQEAMDLLEETKSHGAKNLDDLLQQGGLFGNQSYSPQAVTFAKFIRDAKTNDVVRATRQYAQDADYARPGAGLFENAPTPAESFEQAFK